MSRAFPRNDQYDGNGCHVSNGEPGLTDREYFVAAALQGVLANPSEKQGFKENYLESLRRRVNLAIDAADLALEHMR